MQPATTAYATAIVASYRRILPRVILDIVDPDIVYSPITASGQNALLSRLAKTEG